MPKKSFIVTLFILFPLMVGLACRFTSSPDPTATPTEEPVVAIVETEEAVEEPATIPTRMVEQEEEQEEPTSQPVEAAEDLVILDNSQWIQEGSTVFVGYLVENPAGDILYEDVEFTIRLFGSAGNLIDTGYVSLPWFFPGETRGVVYTFWTTDDSVVVDSVDVGWTFSRKASPGEFKDPFTTDSIVLWDNGGYPIVTGRVVNNTATTYTDIRLDVACFDSTGALVGGGTTYLDFIHLNDYMGFNSYVDVLGDVASVEVFPSLMYSTQVVDKTDFLSDISVQDDYFYQDDFGYLMGGIVVTNETEFVLRNSFVYITFYDENENISSTGSDYIGMILPGDTIGITPWVSVPPEEANSVRYDILLLPGEADDAYELDTNPFRVNSTTVTGDYDNYVRVNFTNTYSKRVSEVDVYVLVYNAAGAIIGGGTTWTDGPTPAGGNSEVEVWVNYGANETIDSIQAWVVPSYWTEFE